MLVLADDLGYSDIGPYGGEIETPNLDRLAAEGLRFRHFYDAGRCCPTRASLLTGRYPHEVGMGSMVSRRGAEPKPGPYQGFLDPEIPTIAERLRRAGYATYMSGKWHVGESPEHWPRQRGFDRYFGLISGASSYYELIRDQPFVRQMALDDDPWEPPAEGFYMTHAFTDFGVRFLDEHAQSRPEVPFFLYLAYTAPHFPLHALPEDIAKYQGRYQGGWDELRDERHARMKEIGLIDDRWELPPRPASVPAWEDADDAEPWERFMEVYAAMVDSMDQGIGRILDSLDRHGWSHDTLVVFLSDNGSSAESVAGRKLNREGTRPGERGSYTAYLEPWAMASNTPLRRYKQWMHEGGISTPFIARWPRVIEDRSRIVSEVGHVIDLSATFLEISGGDRLPDEPRDTAPGKNLLPIFTGDPATPHETLFWEHIGHRAVRQGRFKLTWDRSIRRWELYDLESDPTEIRDLAPRDPDRVEALSALWLRWAEEVGVKTDA